eukprot:CAMPEP_0174279762 /NCGR_PEP_ID=MMETSP0809-20121228/45_1 /TAXON_ID=73025 ORGANISM="Eutreptiella gymnastica-like, Strain CCMP1594" /NCGR_SAMPLE_ID=MMETSP0809 /ASSEMBLY_ACC=CAM_ASM_000658 /LENGTH=351 /DNA_ID=CAMNT_0015372319 /DNA_START=31 /DNA_END=1086 /DNA_ORIENTATION=+
MPSNTTCGCCSTPFHCIFERPHTCTVCKKIVCSGCCTAEVKGLTANNVNVKLCTDCVHRGLVIKGHQLLLEQAALEANMAEKHRREKLQLVQEYDSLENFSVMLQCALKRKTEALEELQELGMATPRFDVSREATPQVRRVALDVPFSPRDDDDDDFALAVRRQCIGTPSGHSVSRQSIGGQSSVSRKSCTSTEGGEGWEEVQDWEDQEVQIRDLRLQVKELKQRNQDTLRKKEESESQLKEVKELQKKDFDRFVKVDMQNLKYETQLLEEQQRNKELQEKLDELTLDHQSLVVSLNNMKAMFEQEIDESHNKISELEQGNNNKGWFGLSSPREKLTTPRPKSGSFSAIQA